MLLLLLGGAGTPVEIEHADLLESLVAAAEDAGLDDEFGRSGWLWIGEAPAGEVMPYAVVTESQGEESYESGGASSVEHAITLEVFSDDRDEARDLADSIAVAWRAAADAGDLIFDDGRLGSVRLLLPGDARTELDPQRGPGGADVWRRVRVFRAITTHTAVTIDESPDVPDPVTADDLAESLIVAATLGDLDDDFGRSGWLWLGEAPAGEPMPYAVLRTDNADQMHESGGASTGEHALSLSIFATGRGTARDLGAGVVAAWRDAHAAGAIRFDGGALLLLLFGRGEDVLDPDRGPSGEDVWQHIRDVRAITEPTA